MRSRGAPVPAHDVAEAGGPQRDLPHDEQRPRSPTTLERGRDRARPARQRRRAADGGSRGQPATSEFENQTYVGRMRWRSDRHPCYQRNMTSTPFGDLDAYLALPRVSGLAVSPDGSRVVTTVTELNDKRTEFVSAYGNSTRRGSAPPAAHPRRQGGVGAGVHRGRRPAVRRGAARTEDDDDGAPTRSLWRLPAAGGEAVEVLAPARRCRALCTPRATPTSPWSRRRCCRRRPASTTTRGCASCARTTRSRRSCTPATRCGTGITTSVPAQPHLFARGRATSRRDLTPDPGSRAARRRLRRQRRRHVRGDVVAGARSRRVDPRRAGAHRRRHRRAHRRSPTIPMPISARPAISPDGRRSHSSARRSPRPQLAPRITLCFMRFGEALGRGGADWDRWPTSVTWSADGASLIVTADDGGRGPDLRRRPGDGRGRPG